MKETERIQLRGLENVQLANKYSGYQNKWNVEMHKLENQLLLFGYQWPKNDLYLILKP